MLHLPNHIKSFQSIYSFRTHKLIKLEMEKQQFFEKLASKLQEDMSPEEFQFLMEYILKEKFSDKPESRMFRNTGNSHKIKEQINPTIDCIHSDVFQSFKHIVKKRKFNNMSIAEQDSPRVRKPKHETKHHTQLYKHLASDDQHTRGSWAKPTQTSYSHKFHKMSIRLRQDERRSSNNQNELPKSPALKMISRQYLQKNYKSSFISNIFDRPSKQYIEPQVDQSFQDNFNNRATEEIQKHKNSELKYRNLTSIRFQKSPRKQPQLKIHSRRF